MSEWPTATLGELCEVEGGNAAPQDSGSYVNGSVPFVRMKDLGRYHHTNNLETTDDKLTEEAIATHRMKIFDPGCILFPRSGSVFLNHRAILGIRASIVSHIGILHGFSDKIYPAFLYRYLLTYDMKRLSKKTTGVDSIAFSDVKKIKIPIPPLDEQEYIIQLLDEAEELRRLRAGTDRRTADLIPALFHNLFGDPLANSHGWPTEELRRLGRVVTGSTPPSSKEGMFKGEIPFITPGDLESKTRDTQRYVTEAGASESRTVRAGSTLVCCIGATIGKTDRSWKRSAFNQQINAVEWGEQIDDDFGVVCIKQCSIMVTNRSSSTALPILKKSLFEQIRIPVPPLSLQRQFAERVAEVRALEENQAASRQRLDDLFQSLLHRAFRGEL
jgi:type I restriction enzyme S subunit